MKCPICESCKTSLFLQRSDVPVHQNLLCPSEEIARNIKRGSLSMTICEECGFVFNRTFDANLLSYGKDYDNTQICSPVFQAYIDGLIYHLISKRGVANKNIVEVGCGNGVFLKRLCELGENTGIGFDPAYTGPEDVLDGKVRFVKDLYGPDSGDLSADVVVCRHVIEHILNPMRLLGAVRDTLRRSSYARVVIETPGVEWVLSNMVVWDFFYEHCSLFSSESLKIALKSAGFHPLRFQHVFGGQYMFVEAELSRSEIAPSPTPNVEKLIELASAYAKNELQFKRYLRKRVKELTCFGPVAVWGAGAKGVTFVNLIDSKRELIDCVVDINPNKQRKFISGTGHPIVSYRDLPSRNVTIAILLNPEYKEENQSLIQNEGIKLNLIELEVV